MCKSLGLISAALGLVVLAGAPAQTVTGSGTSGTVPVFTASSSIGNSPITVNGGNVGIGTTSPAAVLQVGRNDPSTNESLTNASAIDIWNMSGGSNTGGQINFRSDGNLGAAGIGAVIGYLNKDSNSNGSNGDLVFGVKGAYTDTSVTPAVTIQYTGNVGIGTTSPGMKLEVNGNLKLTSGSGASITFADGTQQTTAWTGTLCGGDYAESVDAAGKHNLYAPGDVLVLTGDGKGDVEKSSEPYSTMVAGIYATKPGVVGRRISLPKTADDLPMAMVGIVPTKVTAENGPIRRGDLLVSSSTPGYAMKGTDRSKMLGAVVGKAMGSLESGKGVIEVLVTLQ